MSRIGKKLISIPQGVTVKIKDSEVEVTGSKGSLSLKIRPEIKVEVKEDQVLVNRLKDDKFSRSCHGLTRTLIANMVKGVTEGFSKTLELIGTGYRAVLEGEKLTLFLGFSHPVTVSPPEGINFEIEGDDIIKVTGIDKNLVGQFAAKLRAIRPPEPYKGKGIRYQDEEIKLKPGKAGKAGAAVFGGAK